MHIHIKAWTGDVGVLLTGQTVSPFFVFFLDTGQNCSSLFGSHRHFFFSISLLLFGHWTSGQYCSSCLGPLFMYCLGSCWSAAPTIKTKQNKMSTLIHPPIYKCPHTHSSVPRPILVSQLSMPHPHPGQECLGAFLVTEACPVKVSLKAPN